MVPSLIRRRIVRVDSLVDLDPRLSLEQYQLLYSAPGGPPDRFAQEALAATTRGDLTAFTVYTPYGPNRDEARALVAELRDPAGALAPPEGVTVLVGGGAFVIRRRAVPACRRLRLVDLLDLRDIGQGALGVVGLGGRIGLASMGEQVSECGKRHCGDEISHDAAPSSGLEMTTAATLVSDT